jgi:hypothetical protein
MILNFPSEQQRKKAPSDDAPTNRPIDAPEINSDSPLRLDVAAKIAFPFGGMTASGLRREAKRGRLIVERIAGKDYTTLRYIEEMKRQRRNEPEKAQDCGYSPSVKKKVAASGKPVGSSAMMDRSSSALAALEKTVKALNVPCKNTLPASTKSAETTVVHRLKF